MSKQAGVQSEMVFVKVPDTYAPADRADGSLRLHYLAVATSEMCATVLQSILLRCRSGDFGDAVKEATSRQFTSDRYNGAIKELALITLYLTMLDQTPEAPVWLNDFLSAAAQAVDRVVAGTSAKEIMSIHEFVMGYDVCKESPLNLCRTLDLTSVVKGVVPAFEEFYQKTAIPRSRNLNYALTEQPDILRRKIEQFEQD